MAERGPGDGTDEPLHDEPQDELDTDGDTPSDDEEWDGDDGEFDGAEDEYDEPASRRNWVPFAIVAVVLVVVLGVVLGLVLTRSSPAASSGPEGVPIEAPPTLASADSTAAGAPVDGITCRTSSQQHIKYHIHVHVAVFVNGQEERLPAGAGIPAPRLYEHLTDGLFVDNGINGCLYWLHIHAYDGVIHVESPYKGTFTLGQFFDIWRQPLGVAQVGPAKGTVVAFENGKRFTGNPRDIPLLPHAVVQLDVGTFVPFQPVHFTVKGLCGAGTLNCSASG